MYAHGFALEVVPGYGIARIGGNGGVHLKSRRYSVPVGVDHGTDGTLAPTMTWIWVTSTASPGTVPRDEGAAADRDVEFAGEMDPMGRFVPLPPDPIRPGFPQPTTPEISTLLRAKRMNMVEATGRLLVTVQTGKSTNEVMRNQPTS